MKKTYLMVFILMTSLFLFLFSSFAQEGSVRSEMIPAMPPSAQPGAPVPPAPPRAKPQGIQGLKAGGGKQRVTLDFDNADIYEVINALADIIGMNYIIDPAVKGKVNIHTSGEVDKNQILPILEIIFEMNNIAAVKTGDIYKIIPIKEAKTRPLMPETGREMKEEDLQSPDRMRIQFVPLRYIPVGEMSKLLKPFLTKAGEIMEYPKNNVMIVVDTNINVKRLLSMVDTVDVSYFEGMNVKFYELKNADVKDLAKEMETIFGALGIGKGTDKGVGVNFIPLERMNMMLVIVSQMPDILAKVDDWVVKLDEINTDVEEQIFIYFLENSKATDVGDILNKVYGEGVETKKKEGTPVRKTPTKPGATPAATATVAGKIKIVTDEVTNALIIRATTSDYNIIKKTIQLLDIVPRQVLIEVLIAEISLGDDTQFGVDWNFKKKDVGVGGETGTFDSILNNNIPTTLASPAAGYTAVFAASDLYARLYAYAGENRLNVLSSPHILAANNKEAKIEVGQEVPIVTSEYAPDIAGTTDVTSRSIQYRDTGILLTVTPRINEKGLVAMDISQEVSQVSDQTIVGISSPIITKRSAKTSLVVQNGSTIVIGGLIQEQKERSMSGIPFFSKIPLLNYFFSYTKDKVTKTELVILITPHTIRSLEEADLITKEFKDKIEGLKKMIGTGIKG
ncbi:MAG TPA: type II secretion system secretin GspD [Thermodesulfobacteriota bacterium]|nr:type II secretion system secretin GspD [Thermodesulfobacteriota bacterium]